VIFNKKNTTMSPYS